jgi:hypothetical protein
VETIKFISSGSSLGIAKCLRNGSVKRYNLSDDTVVLDSSMFYATYAVIRDKIPFFTGSSYMLVLLG